MDKGMEFILWNNDLEILNTRTKQFHLERTSKGCLNGEDIRMINISMKLVLPKFF